MCTEVTLIRIAPRQFTIAERLNALQQFVTTPGDDRRQNWVPLPIRRQVVPDVCHSTAGTEPGRYIFVWYRHLAGVWHRLPAGGTAGTEPGRYI